MVVIVTFHQKLQNLVKQVRIFLHSDQKNSEHGHFLRSGRLILTTFLNWGYATFQK